MSTEAELSDVALDGVLNAVQINPKGTAKTLDTVEVFCDIPGRS